MPLPENFTAFMASEYLLPLSKEPTSISHSDQDEYDLPSSGILP